MPSYKYQRKNVHYEEFGEGTPLLFLHGNTASSQMFLEVVNEFASSNKVVLIDFLGHGRSDRLEQFPVDLWFDEAQQVISFINEKHFEKVNLLGSSGGALVAINVGLERPDLIGKIIADSFEGEKALGAFTEGIVQSRQLSKENPNAAMFYRAMHGDDWETVVDNDTRAVDRHSKTIGNFFHKPLSALTSEILLTGSLEDEFLSGLEKNFLRDTYSNMLEKIGHGSMHLFQHGGHPAMLSNIGEFNQLAQQFLSK